MVRDERFQTFSQLDKMLKSTEPDLIMSQQTFCAFCACVQDCTWLEARVPGVCPALLESVTAGLSAIFPTMTIPPEVTTPKFQR